MKVEYSKSFGNLDQGLFHLFNGRTDTMWLMNDGSALCHFGVNDIMKVF